MIFSERASRRLKLAGLAVVETFIEKYEEVSEQQLPRKNPVIS